MLDATSKLYSYRICFDSAMDPLQRYHICHYLHGHEMSHPIEPSFLREILQCYVGTHDFICFAGSLESNQRKQSGRIQTTVRTIHSIKVGTGKKRIITNRRRR
jgi:tRNA U38,U39,U40 pseudouridine synthase TruA